MPAALSSNAWCQALGDSCPHGQDGTGPVYPPDHLKAQTIKAQAPREEDMYFLRVIVVPAIALRHTRCVKDTKSSEGLLK